MKYQALRPQFFSVGGWGVVGGGGRVGGGEVGRGGGGKVDGGGVEVIEWVVVGWW